MAIRTITAIAVAGIMASVLGGCMQPLPPCEDEDCVQARRAAAMMMLGHMLNQPPPANPFATYRPPVLTNCLDGGGSFQCTTQ